MLLCDFDKCTYGLFILRIHLEKVQVRHRRDNTEMCYVAYGGLPLVSIYRNMELWLSEVLNDLANVSCAPTVCSV